ncbi:hypothetical protein DH2020_002801 [Rehmannia glutinosa]|uniref:YqaJ viral recombinase domain-containing protein n=1 Tax=Rehmannia glutinosa TaxID=99300 RepID=A0ABR0XV74_REHGL
MMDLFSVDGFDCLSPVNAKIGLKFSLETRNITIIDRDLHCPVLWLLLRKLKNLKISISSVGYLKFNKHINNFKKIIISPFCGNRRWYSGSPCEIFSSKSHPILQSSGLQHWFKNWQHLRKHKLTASTFGLAIGFWPRGRARLWLEKLGTIEPFSGNLATCWSNIKEEEALERYKLITGNTVTYPEFQVYGKKNPEDNWLAASPDGAVDSFYYGLPTRGIALSDFWWKHVQPAKEICNRSVITNPLIELSSFRPAPKHELYQSIVYESKLLVDDSKLLMREIHGRLQN